MTIPKIICLVGPTASGKSELAVKLAKKFNGEIISVDSRQIYRDMNIGTGKVEGAWINSPMVDKRHGRAERKPLFVYKNIIHHCIDFVNPRRRYSVAQFKRQAEKAIKDIVRRGKLPILCGGTGHWMDAVVLNQALPEVKPNPKLRKQLDSQSANQLFSQLQKLDPARAASIDSRNKRRLVRALEIIVTTGKQVPPLKIGNWKLEIYHHLWLGITLPQEILYKKIERRLKQRLAQGMIQEVKKLHKKGLLWSRLETFGLEYKFIALYLQDKLSYDDMVTQLSFAIKHYSKRQLTWFKRNQRIQWISTYQEAKQKVDVFLK